MNIRQAMRTKLVRFVIGERMQRTRRWLAEKRRKLTARPHTVSVFLELDDPYSYLLSHYLPSLAAAYDIELRLYLTQACGDAFRPEPSMLAQYAEQDCARLARELGIPFLDKGNAPPVEHRRALINTLAADTDGADYSDELVESLALYWRGDIEAIARRVSGAEQSDAGDKLLLHNQRRLIDLGHYDGASVHYAGEWYRGVDRLCYLTDRLDALGARKQAVSSAMLASIRQVMQVSLPVAPPSAAKDLPPLELFVSFRSPFSFLLLNRVYAIADSFGLELKIRPVLPMLMRGMQVPRSKLMYLVIDAAREARRLELPFGKISDPMGKGTERCLAVFFYALGEKRERDFLLNAGEAIWANAINVSTDKGMRKVTGRTGLFWPDVVNAMARDDWRKTAEANRESMMDSGSWGVPTMRLGDFVVWGQDRDWLLVRHIEELCDTGDGILV
ncbi:MAG: DsbA family protein [Gammaproteobacteria bacterium]|nr:DsbA family protein [Gammaproteobacteria bacterium]